MAYQAAKVDSDTAKGILDNLTSNKTDYDTAKQAVYSGRRRTRSREQLGARLIERRNSPAA